MTANDLLNKQLDDVSYQLDKVFEGVSEADLDFKVAPAAMSIREIAEHLCEVYTAVETESNGGSHSWGSFSIEDKSWSNLMEQFHALRANVLAIASNASDEKAVLNASAYLVAHDYYHVGQLASLRLATDSGWDAYSIYKHE